MVYIEDARAKGLCLRKAEKPRQETKRTMGLCGGTSKRPAAEEGCQEGRGMFTGFAK